MVLVDFSINLDLQRDRGILLGGLTEIFFEI